MLLKCPAHIPWENVSALREPTISWVTGEVAKFPQQVFEYTVHTAEFKEKKRLHLTCLNSYSTSFPSTAATSAILLPFYGLRNRFKKMKLLAESTSPLSDRNSSALIKHTTYIQVPGNMCWSILLKPVRHCWSKPSVSKWVV